MRMKKKTRATTNINQADGTFDDPATVRVVSGCQNPRAGAECPERKPGWQERRK